MCFGSPSLRDTMVGWILIVGTSIFLSIFLINYFFKINWIRDERTRGGAKDALRKHFESKGRKIGKLPPVYPNGWFALLECSKLKNGQVRHVSALGQNFAVFRTEKGVVSVLDAYCPHLGANMGETGQVKGECLECPFHGWRFRGDDGNCESIPYAEKVPRVAKVKKWISCIANEIIFVWYHAEESKPNWQPRTHRAIENRSFSYQGRNEFYVNCHIQEIAENGADWAHLNSVHGPLLFLRKYPWLARHSWSNVSWVPDSAFFHEEPVDESSSSNDSESTKHRARATLKHTLVLFETLTIFELDVDIHQIGPGYVELIIGASFGPIVIFQTVTPVEPLLQKVINVIYSPPLLGPIASLFFIGESLMFERDVEIWNRKEYKHQPLLVKEDKAILTYRRWFSQFYSPRSPSYRNAVKSLQW